MSLKNLWRIREGFLQGIVKDFLKDFLKDFYQSVIVRDFLKELVKDSWRIRVRNGKPIISKGIISFLWKTNYSFRKPICFIGFPLNYCIKINKTNVFKRLGMGRMPHGLKTLVLFVFMQWFKGKPIKHIGFLKEYLVFI